MRGGESNAGAQVDSGPGPHGRAWEAEAPSPRLISGDCVWGDG